MSAANLLNLNVDSLFETHSVPEIDIVQKKIQAVVENKREELRQMVGERYRDLLQAADTIAAMQDSSGTLITQVDCISANCRSLNEQQLLGFKTTTDSAATDLRQRSANKQLSNYFGTMVQIKLLTALPELIWTHIDREHFYAASELFIFSRHISTGLQLDVHNPLMQHLPVARKQWEILKPFHVTIKQCVLAVLEREELDADVAADCLLSLLLLERGNLNGLFKTFLQLRCGAFLSCLTEAERGGAGVVEGEARRRVKDRILASLKVLNGTMELIDKCFLENGLLFSKLAEYADANAAPTIARMDGNDAQFAHMLPEIICNFRPKFEPQTLDSEQVCSALEKWLADTKRIAGVQLKQLFELVSTMSTIQDIKSAANAERNCLNISHIAENFQLPAQTLDFYEAQYVPLINQRVRDIINGSWTCAMHATYDTIAQALPNAGAVAPDMWLDQVADLPLSLEQALSDDRKCKKLLMKTQGYDAEIIALCTAFDRQLAAIVAEMNVLLAEQATRATDKFALVEFLRETAQTQLTHFIGRLKLLQLVPQQRAELLFVVRACVALVELCPNLRICFCQQSSWRQWVAGGSSGANVSTASSTNSLEHWQRICLLLEEETFNFWLQIVEGFLAEQHCGAHLAAAITHDVVLEDFALWETVTLEQKDEQDNAIHSTIRIPSQPRISLQSHLFTLIRALNADVPQTLPPKVLHAFNAKLLAQLLAHYETLAAQESTAASQNIALQLYFDLKFLQSAFAVSRDERALIEHFGTLQNALRNCIDPFDFELFAEHISANVKRAVGRLNCELGVLTPSATAMTTGGTPALQEKDPNVLSLSTCQSSSLWFPLLPIFMPNAGATEQSRRLAALDSEKPTTTTPTSSSTPTRKAAAASRKSDTATKSKSSAASFFGGVMPQEWFR